MNVLALLWFLVRLSKTHLRWFVGRGRQQGLRASVSVCLCVCVCVCMCATPVPKDVGRTSALLKAGGGSRVQSLPRTKTFWIPW